MPAIAVWPVRAVMAVLGEYRNITFVFVFSFHMSTLTSESYSTNMHTVHSALMCWIHLHVFHFLNFPLTQFLYSLFYCDICVCIYVRVVLDFDSGRCRIWPRPFSEIQLRPNFRQDLPDAKSSCSTFSKF